MNNPNRQQPTLKGRRVQALLSSQSGIYAFPELLARLEMGYMLCRQCDRIAGFRISANTRRTIMQGKTAKSPDFNPLPGSECPAHLFKQTLDRQFDILVIQMSVFGREYLDQFRLCHFIHQPGLDFPFSNT